MPHDCCSHLHSCPEPVFLIPVDRRVHTIAMHCYSFDKSFTRKQPHKTPQRGVSTNAYDGGRFSFRFEEPVHRFQSMVVQMMTGGAHKCAKPRYYQNSLSTLVNILMLWYSLTASRFILLLEVIFSDDIDIRCCLCVEIYRVLGCIFSTSALNLRFAFWQSPCVRFLRILHLRVAVNLTLCDTCVAS